MIRTRSHYWLLAGAAGLCALAAGWLWTRELPETARRKGVAAAVQRAFAGERRAGTRTVPIPAAEAGIPVSPLRTRLLALRKAEKVGEAVTLMEALAVEPDAEKWVDGLYQILILNHQDPYWGGTLWGAWTGGLRKLHAATFIDRMDNLPSYLVEQWKDARVTSGGRGSRRALAELARLLHVRMHSDGRLPNWMPAEIPNAPEILKNLVTAAEVGLTAAETMKAGADLFFLRGDHISPDYYRLAELDIIDRLRNEPDHLLNYTLNYSQHLTHDDPDLRAATARVTFFYTSGRLDTVLAAPPSAARDALLASAASLPVLAAEERSRLMAAISDEAFRLRVSSPGSSGAPVPEEEMEE